MDDDEEEKKEEKKEGEKKKKTMNPFKHLIIKQVQKIFDDTEEDKKIVMETNPDRIADVMRERKKKILGNVRFIGELIIQKVLSNKVSSLCILDLLSHFFDQLHLNHTNNKLLAEIFM